MPKIGDPVKQNSLNCITPKAQKILAKRKSRLTKFFDKSIVEQARALKSPDGFDDKKESESARNDIPILILNSPNETKPMLYSEKSVK